MNVQHVVVVNDSAHINGGSAQVAIASARLLAEAGIQVHYFCATQPTDAALTRPGIEVTCTGQPDLLGAGSRVSAAVRGLWNRSAERRLQQLLAGLPPLGTVVHVHGWTKALTASVFPAALKAGTPLVLTLHDYFTACPNGGFYDYQRQEICDRVPMGLSCVATHCDSRAYSHKVWRLARQVLIKHLADVPAALTDVIVLSETSRRVLQPHYPASVRWHAVRNPIDVAPRLRTLAEQNKPFVFVGRLAAEKGADLFAEAAISLGLQARVVGDGEERANLQRQWPALDVTGWLAPAQVQAALAAARALVLPSRWYEGQPLVVQEALAMGVPVIVADRTGSRDLVVHGENGLLFEQGNLQSLKAMMSRMAADDALVEAMSQRAHAMFWQDPPTAANHLRDLLPVYGMALQAGPRAGAAPRPAGPATTPGP